ncbi:hypothetical protein EDC57_1062 [Inmirania thermothiophila]|uniref:Uncharacterized protein n=1 Tax=Inmirania thermothiophila TaxID=1750597 RepID=A0A3N1Y8P2_9GAMM|nr:hypothetical protein EDC57_1062 [Inmirania thermothiophila]
MFQTISTITNNSCRVSSYNCFRRNILCNNSAGAYNSLIAYFYARQNDCPSAYPYIIPNNYRANWHLPLLIYRDIQSFKSVVIGHNNYVWPHYDIITNCYILIYSCIMPDLSPITNL